MIERTLCLMAIVIASTSLATRASAQDVPPPPPTTSPPTVIVVPAPAPGPAPQTVVVAPAPAPTAVYVPVASAQYPTTVYTQAQPPPEPPRQRHHLNLAPVIAGAVMLGVGWVCEIVASLFAGVHLWGPSPDEAWSSFRLTGLIPVIGPWIQLGVQPTRFDEDGWGPWLVFDGLLQAAGLVTLIVGIATMGGEEPETAERDGDVELTVLPLVGQGYAGLSALGRF